MSSGGMGDTRCGDADKRESFVVFCDESDPRLFSSGLLPARHPLVECHRGFHHPSSPFY